MSAGLATRLALEAVISSRDFDVSVAAGMLRAAFPADRMPALLAARLHLRALAQALAEERVSTQTVESLAALAEGPHVWISPPGDPIISLPPLDPTLVSRALHCLIALVLAGVEDASTLQQLQRLSHPGEPLSPSMPSPSTPGGAHEAVRRARLRLIEEGTDPSMAPHARLAASELLDDVLDYLARARRALPPPPEAARTHEVARPRLDEVSGNASLGAVGAGYGTGAGVASGSAAALAAANGAAAPLGPASSSLSPTRVAASGPPLASPRQRTPGSRPYAQSNLASPQPRAPHSAAEGRSEGGSLSRIAIIAPTQRLFSDDDANDRAADAGGVAPTQVAGYPGDAATSPDGQLRRRVALDADLSPVQRGLDLAAADRSAAVETPARGLRPRDSIPATPRLGSGGDAEGRAESVVAGRETPTAAERSADQARAAAGAVPSPRRGLDSLSAAGRTAAALASLSAAGGADPLDRAAQEAARLGRGRRITGRGEPDRGVVIGWNSPSPTKGVASVGENVVHATPAAAHRTLPPSIRSEPVQAPSTARAPARAAPPRGAAPAAESVVGGGGGAGAAAAGADVATTAATEGAENAAPREAARGDRRKPSRTPRAAELAVEPAPASTTRPEEPVEVEVPPENAMPAGLRAALDRGLAAVEASVQRSTPDAAASGRRRVLPRSLASPVADARAAGNAATVERTRATAEPPAQQLSRTDPSTTGCGGARGEGTPTARGQASRLPLPLETDAGPAPTPASAPQPPAPRRRSRWTDRETELLRRAVRRMGSGVWARVQRWCERTARIEGFEFKRGQVDIKDKWRNLGRAGDPICDEVASPSLAELRRVAETRRDLLAQRKKAQRWIDLRTNRATSAAATADSPVSGARSVARDEDTDDDDLDADDLDDEEAYELLIRGARPGGALPPFPEAAARARVQAEFARWEREGRPDPAPEALGFRGVPDDVLEGVQKADAANDAERESIKQMMVRLRELGGARERVVRRGPRTKREPRLDVAEAEARRVEEAETTEGGAEPDADGRPGAPSRDVRAAPESSEPKRTPLAEAVLIEAATENAGARPAVARAGEFEYVLGSGRLRTLRGAIEVRRARALRQLERAAGTAAFAEVAQRVANEHWQEVARRGATELVAIANPPKRRRRSGAGAQARGDEGERERSRAEDDDEMATEAGEQAEGAEGEAGARASSEAAEAQAPTPSDGIRTRARGSVESSRLSAQPKQTTVVVVDEDPIEDVTATQSSEARRTPESASGSQNGPVTAHSKAPTAPKRGARTLLSSLHPSAPPAATSVQETQPSSPPVAAVRPTRRQRGGRRGAAQTGDVVSLVAAGESPSASAGEGGNAPAPLSSSRRASDGATRNRASSSSSSGASSSEASSSGSDGSDSEDATTSSSESDDSSSTGSSSTSSSDDSSSLTDSTTSSSSLSSSTSASSSSTSATPIHSQSGASYPDASSAPTPPRGGGVQSVRSGTAGTSGGSETPSRRGSGQPRALTAEKATLPALPPRNPPSSAAKGAAKQAANGRATDPTSSKPATPVQRGPSGSREAQTPTPAAASAPAAPSSSTPHTVASSSPVPVIALGSPGAAQGLKRRRAIRGAQSGRLALQSFTPLVDPQRKRPKKGTSRRSPP